MLQNILNLLTILSIAFGLFFMFIGALGLWRLPDLYHRMHAASKCVTLGLCGMMLAAVFHLSAVAAVAKEPLPGVMAADVDAPVSRSVVAVMTKAVLVIVFQFVASPIAAHMLARAAHLDGSPIWEGTLSDELAEDRKPRS